MEVTGVENMSIGSWDFSVIQNLKIFYLCYFRYLRYLLYLRNLRNIVTFVQECRCSAPLQ